MITDVRICHGSPNPDSVNFGPDELLVRWDCDYPGCKFSGELDDGPRDTNGKPLDDFNEGDATFCADCVERLRMSNE